MVQIDGFMLQILIKSEFSYSHIYIKCHVSFLLTYHSIKVLFAAYPHCVVFAVKFSFAEVIIPLLAIKTVGYCRADVPVRWILGG